MGGSVRTWQGPLAGRPVPGSAVGLRLVLTKFGPPDVRIAYSIRFVSA